VNKLLNPAFCFARGIKTHHSAVLQHQSNKNTLGWTLTAQQHTTNSHLFSRKDVLCLLHDPKNSFSNLSKLDPGPNLKPKYINIDVNKVLVDVNSEINQMF